MRPHEVAGRTWPRKTRSWCRTWCRPVLPLTTVQKVLANLLAERVSIRHLDADPGSYARGRRLHPQCPADHRACSRPTRAADLRALQGEDGLHRRHAAVAAWEREMSEAIIVDGDQRSFVLAPSRTQEFVQTVRTDWRRSQPRGTWPAISPAPRRGRSCAAWWSASTRPSRDLPRRGASALPGCARWRRSEESSIALPLPFGRGYGRRRTAGGCRRTDLASQPPPTGGWMDLRPA